MAFKGLLKGETGTKSINVFLPTAGTPVNGVVAQGTLTVDTQATAADTMTIGATVYTFVADGAEADTGDISVGTDVSTCRTNIVAAINGTDSINTANTEVSAGNFSFDDCVLTAITGGIAGNSIVTTETFDEATNVFDAGTLGTTQAGVDGTVAQRAGQCYIDASYIYYSVAENTTAGDNWRRITLGSAY